MELSHEVIGEQGQHCLVCGILLEDRPAVRYVAGDQPVMVCGNACLRVFLEDPELYLLSREEDEENDA